MPRFGTGLSVITGTDVAANTEWTETVPDGEYWRVLSVTITLVQGATQTPQPKLIVNDGTTTLFASFGSTTAQAVSTTQRYTWAPGLTLSGNVGATTNVHSVAPFPDGFVLGPGYKLNSGTTVGIGANSNYTAPTFYVVVYKSDPSGWTGWV